MLLAYLHIFNFLLQARGFGIMTQTYIAVQVANQALANPQHYIALLFVDLPMGLESCVLMSHQKE